MLKKFRLLIWSLTFAILGSCNGTDNKTSPEIATSVAVSEFETGKFFPQVNTMTFNTSCNADQYSISMSSHKQVNYNMLFSSENNQIQNNSTEQPHLGSIALNQITANGILSEDVDKAEFSKLRDHVDKLTVFTWSLVFECETIGKSTGLSVMLHLQEAHIGKKSFLKIYIFSDGTITYST